ncbi:MAG TPA: flagellar export chaperone FliS [Terracidiphilus sp.]|jgi:flagellar protein FliS
MDTYRSHALEGASGVELTIALYDGIVRFMYKAIEAVERKDADARRAAVKRGMDILIHLQATLDKKVGGNVAETLSEFYTAMFALMLQGSQANSRKKFEQVIADLRNVREAWKQAAADAAGRHGAAGAEQSGVLAAAWGGSELRGEETSWTA